MAKKIGIFSGTFDPVHRGHIEACVVALGALELDTVLIFIEKKPQRKTDIANFKDRANMLELAAMNYPSLRLVDLEADNITTKSTLQYLSKHFADDNYWYIVGSDMLNHIEEWPDHEKLLKTMSVCVVLRGNDEESEVRERLEKLHKKYHCRYFVLPSVWSPISSSKIKKFLKDNEIMTGLDPAVYEYIKRHNLYQ